MVYSNVTHVQKSGFQGIQDMNELHLDCMFQHGRVYRRKKRQHHLFQLTLSALVFLDVHPFLLFSTEEHFDLPSAGQSVASTHLHVLSKANDTLLNP
jgi:hypothetical protein